MSHNTERKKNKIMIHSSYVICKSHESTKKKKSPILCADLIVHAKSDLVNVIMHLDFIFYNDNIRNI